MIREESNYALWGQDKGAGEIVCVKTNTNVKFPLTLPFHYTGKFLYHLQLT